MTRKQKANPDAGPGASITTRNGCGLRRDRAIPVLPIDPRNIMTNRLPTAAACAALALTPLAQATDVAPYFETWAYGSSTAPSTLMQAKSAGGVASATMAFGVSGGGCSLGGGLEANMSGAGKTDIASFQAAGGRAILSFGG